MSAYRPQGAIVELASCREREVLAYGPVRTGKTRGVLEKDQAVAIRRPGARILWLRRYRASMTQTVLETFENHVAAWARIEGNRVGRGNRQSYRFANGSEIVVGGLDAFERLMSGEYDRISLFEATEVKEAEPYEYLLTRLSGREVSYNQVTCDCNPGPPTHWLWKRATSGDMHPIFVDHRSNPLWWNEAKKEWTPRGTEYVLGHLERLTGTAYRRLVKGEWVAAEGQVFDNFDTEQHVTTQSGTPDEVVIGCDDGVADPFAALRIEVRGDSYHVSDERYGSGMRLGDRTAAVRELGGEEALVVYDSAAATLGQALREEFADVRRSAKNAAPLTDQIQIVRQLIDDGRLTVSPTCTNLLNEMGLYEWKRRQDQSTKDVPIDQHNHAIDALRYAIVMHQSGLDDVLVV